MRRMPHVLMVGLLVALVVPRVHAVPAFSGAEGWGAVTPGGRGGQVIHVTNLNNSGPGSFRAAVTASGPRTVVFDVAGQINLLTEVSITNPFLTIAGQTAPGGGITIAGETVSMDTHDVIVRYMRFRRGTTAREDDSFGPDRTPGNMIIDHVSASWGYDENISIYRNKNAAGNVIPTHNVTIQWSISSEGLNEPSDDHPFGHAFGSTLGGKGVNFHHNLWASNTGRNPSLSFSHFIDFRNNVLFNWQHRSMDGAGPESHVNVINNYYKPGPASGKQNSATQDPISHLKVRIVEPEIRRQAGETQSTAGPGKVGWWFVDGNVVEGFPEVSADNWVGESEVAPGVFARGVQFEGAPSVLPYPGPGPGAGDQMEDHPEWARVLAPHVDLSNPGPYPFDLDPRDPYDAVIPALPTIATQSAADAYQAVLAGAGASLVRDAVDVRVIGTATTGNATAGPDGDGIVHTIDQVGGYPVIPFVARGVEFDTDQDGMPDEWELYHGLDPANAADGNGDFDADGYTNLEEYLNEIGAFAAVQDVVWNGGVGRYALIDNWTIAFQPSRFDTAVIRNGTATVDAVGQHAGTLELGTQPGDIATLNIAGGRLEVANEVVIGVDDGAEATLNLSGGTLSTPLLAMGEGGSFNFTGGTLHADTVAFDLENNGGTLAPGRSIGVTNVMGDLTLQSGVLEIEIGGKAFGEFDRLEVDGAAALGGTLKVEFIDLGEGEFVPQQGDVFAFLTAFGGYGGTFDAFVLPELAPGLAWAFSPGDIVLYLAVVSVPLAGDYNNDGSVDAADYTVWRNRLGSAISLPNETASPGVVDEDDYAAWKANFGAASADAASSTAVPEPQLPQLILASCGLILLVRRRIAADVVRNAMSSSTQDAGSGTVDASPDEPSPAVRPKLARQRLYSSWVPPVLRQTT